jgi:hypothetical protein
MIGQRYAEQCWTILPDHQRRAPMVVRCGNCDITEQLSCVCSFADMVNTRAAKFAPGANESSVSMKRRSSSGVIASYFAENGRIRRPSETSHRMRYAASARGHPGAHGLTRSRAFGDRGDVDRGRCCGPDDGREPKPEACRLQRPIASSSALSANSFCKLPSPPSVSCFAAFAANRFMTMPTARVR